MNPGATPADVAAVLAHVTAGLPGHEDRPGQLRMAELVAEAIQSKKHLIVQAGTGTGKTLAYLIPALSSGTRTVVVTATKALQDQLAGKDLPFLAGAAEHLPVSRVDWAVLKGRSNYLCRQRLAELQDPTQASLDLSPVDEDDPAEAITDPSTLGPELEWLADWADQTLTGDVSELERTPSAAAWRAVSVGSDECPGARRCPLGDICFAELARHNAAEADVIVVNTHLYGLHIGSGGALLPDHDLVIFDEAHVLEDIISDTVGVQLTPGRFHHLATAVGQVLVDPGSVDGLREAAESLRHRLAPEIGNRLGPPLPEELAELVGGIRSRIGDLNASLLGVETTVDSARQRVLRAQQLAGRLASDCDLALTATEGTVAFASGTPRSPRLELAPLDVAPTLADQVWSTRLAILCSATIPSSLPERLGLPRDQLDMIDVGSPFDHDDQALLYCALHLPDPRSADHRTATHDELATLIDAAGGRTLALFTSWAAMDAAAEAIRARLDLPILTQRDLPKPALLAAFAADEATSLFATAGFFQGIDVPGRTLSLVVIDRIPFPRPDDPLLSARREHLGSAAFGSIDLPRAATMLAQAAGRLIRTKADRGVVAVLDRRLGTARYRWELVDALPPMRRTRSQAEAITFLRSLHAEHDGKD